MSSKIWIENNKERIREYHREHYRRNPDYYKNRNKLRKKTNKIFVEGLKKDLSCSHCGMSDHRCLDFHHVDSSLKKENIAKAASMGWSEKALLEEISKCIPLCANCHRIYHYAPVV